MMRAKFREIFADPYGTASLIYRLLDEEASRYRLSYLLAFALMGIVAASTAAAAYLIGSAVNQTYVAQNFTATVAFSISVIAIFAAKGFASYWQAIVLTHIGNDMVAQNQQRMCAKLLSENMGYFANRPSAAAIALVNQGANSGPSAINLVVVSMGRDCLSLIGLAAVMFYQDPAGSLLAVLVMPISLLFVRNLVARIRSLRLRQLADASRLMEGIQEFVQGMRVVKAFALEQEIQRRIKDSAEAGKSAANSMARIANRSGPVMESLGGCAIALAFLYGGYRVIVMGAAPGEFVSFLTAFLLAYEPAKRLARFRLDLSVNLLGVQTMYELLDSPPSEPQDPEKPCLRVSAGRIELRGVEFSYRPGHKTLRKMSFQATPGRTTALVGPSGGGKSTVFNLILRLHEPERGTVFVDGQNVAAVSRSSVRRQIAYVGQDVFLFRTSIRENIRYGKLDATDDQIIAAATDAQAHSFIMSLPEGYDTAVGEHGLQLSSGQRQRVAIARALLKDAPIILLDEPTSALDSEAELQVQQAIQRLCAGRTTLVIAHRLHTITGADRIHVVENGMVVESGSHDDLLRRSGRYAWLYNLLLQQQKTIQRIEPPIRSNNLDKRVGVAEQV